MIEIRQTPVFSDWLSRLRDDRAASAIARKIERVALGNFGDAKSLGGSISELRIDVGAGFRAYFTRRGLAIVLLLCGGDKSSQARDIARARQLAEEE